MHSLHRVQLRAGTVLSILALLVASVGGIRALQATGRADAQPRPVVNLSYLKEESEVDGGSFTTLGFDCPAGRSLISGGFYHGTANLFSAGSYPYIPRDEGIGRGWTITASNLAPLVPTDSEVTATIVCVKPGLPVVPPG